MEHYVKSTDASTGDEFLNVGLADRALLGIHNQDVIAVSADLGFYTQRTPLDTKQSTSIMSRMRRRARR
jgi:hypothetical protein